MPFTVRGQGRMPGGTVTLDASGSSQLVSGLLLAAPRYDKGAEIRHAGPRVPSAPHIAMTVAMLRAAGADVETGPLLLMMYGGYIPVRCRLVRSTSSPTCPMPGRSWPRRWPPGAR